MASDSHYRLRLILARRCGWLVESVTLRLEPGDSHLYRRGWEGGETGSYFGCHPLEIRLLICCYLMNQMNGYWNNECHTHLN